jgi:lysophospholipase L1-like esterase
MFDRVPRPGLIRASVLVAVLALAALLAAAAPADQTRSYYLSLGDSLARGWQPDARGHTRETTQGYVDDVAASLARSHPGLRVVKLGCAGETTTRMMRGGSCHYTTGSQLNQAVAFLRAHPGEVVAVTVNIGDNDVEECLTGGAVDSRCVRSEMAEVKARLPQIAARLRSAAGSRARIVGLTDYDQFLAYWLRGASGRSFARASVGVVERLNSSADAIYRRANVRAADATHAFATSDLTHTVRTSRGTLPRAVARVCAWTWACSGPPINFNDHANARGYGVLARVVLAALR